MNLTDLLKQSKRPVILLGAGAREAAGEIISFSERWGIPMLTTWNAVDLVWWEHPNFIGRPGIVATRASNFAVQESDLFISIGARLDPATIAFDYDKFAPNAKKVMVDIDENEGNKIPNLDLFIHSDALRFANDPIYDLPDYSEWLKTCWEWKEKYKPEGNTITYQLCEQLGHLLTWKDVLVISTSGMTGGTIFPAFFKNAKGLRVVTTASGLGSMGGGIPAAIGVSLASKKRVICVDGDGSFMQNIQELEVVFRLKLNILFFVVNNGGYSSVRDSQLRAFQRESGVGEESGLTLPDIANVARGFGIYAKKIYDTDSIDILMVSGWPQVIEVIAPPDEKGLPRVMFDGRGNLGDMFPYDTL